MDTDDLDIETIKNGWLKSYCISFAQRTAEIRSSLVAGYGMPPDFDDIEIAIARDAEINAEATWIDRRARLRVNLGTIVAVRLLYDRLLTNDLIFHELAQPDGERIRYRGQFILNANKPLTHSESDINLSQRHAALSNVLSDFCLTFVVLHEVGHLLCGHIGCLASSKNGGRLTELVTQKAVTRAELDPKLRRYWEFQADSIGASFLAQYIDHFASRSRQLQPWFFELNGLAGANTSVVAMHACALVIAALHVFFLYLDNCNFSANANSYHPPAQTRVMVVRDALASQTAARFGVSEQEIVDLYFERYLSPLISLLDEVGLNAMRGFGSAHLKTVDRYYQNIRRSNARYRTLCAKWSMLPVDDWKDPTS